jgi:hypothetical protein
MSMHPSAEKYIQERVAAAVREVIRTQYPVDYSSLCHAFAVVGTNVAAVVLERSFRPVAGLAAIDSGANQLIVMADDRAFANEQGGAYHCWIESTDHTPGEKLLLDFTIGHNHIYARKNGFAWAGASAPRFLWGRFDELALTGPLHALQPGFGKHKIWLQETDAGVTWMARHLESNINGYISLTAAALKIYQKGIKPSKTRPWSPASAGHASRQDAGNGPAAFALPA